jgi:uncharacterized protein YlxP (DUF503 family)
LHVASLTMELRLPAAHSLKEKRAALRPILDGARRRFAVAAAEVGRQDAWQHAIVGMAAVSGSAHHAREVLDSVERFVWSFPEVEVTSCTRGWMSDEDVP